MKIQKSKTSKNNKTIQPISPNKISTILSERKFWEIIDESLKHSKTEAGQIEYLTDLLITLPTNDIIGFNLRTEKLLYDTYTSEMWCAAVIMNNGCNPDEFQYFRNWIISRGKSIYMKAKKNPDSLFHQLDNGKAFYRFEEFWYVAITAFEKKTGKDIEAFIDYKKFKYLEGNYPKMKFTWNSQKPHTLKAICPRLYAKLIN